jgi:hypothetical protein
MKQSISPAVMAAIIVVVVAVIGFFGYKAFMGGPASGGSKPAAAQDGAKFQQQYQNYGQQRKSGGFRNGAALGGPSGG